MASNYLFNDQLNQSLNLKNDILILDFDHTLFLSNSTEEYLSCAYPSILTGLVLALIEGLKPWRLFPGDNSRFVYRDAIRVLLVTILFPWTILVWKLRAPKISSKYINYELLCSLELSNWKTIIIATNGFKFIVSSLLNCFEDFQVDILVSCEFSSVHKSVRKYGKLKVIESLDADFIDFSKSTFITDNEDDLDLMSEVDNPISLTWEKAKHFRACENTYIPFVYTEGSDRGNSGHFVKVVLLTNYLILLLTYGFSTNISLNVIISLFLFSISFWCIYEAGYYENDFYEINYESTKGAGKKSLKFKDYPIETGAWIWSLGLGFTGILTLNYGELLNLTQPKEYFITWLVWASWLLIVRLTFRAYNYSKVKLRILIYPILQVFRLSGPLIFMPLNILGVFLIISQAISRWVWYLVYRTGGDRKNVPHHIVLLFILLSLTILYILSSGDVSILFTWQFLFILLWSLARSKPQIESLFSKESS